MLPALKNEQRLSKHIIVDASISHHKAQDAKCLQASQAIQALLAEREDLLREVNALRALCQPGACIPRQARPIDPGMLETLASPKELAADPIIRPEGVGESVPVSAASSTALAQNHVPQPPITLSDDRDRPSLPQHQVDWGWDQSSLKPTQAVTLSVGPEEEHSILWNGSSGVLTQTPPKDAELEYDTNVNHLVDDAALFWTQQAGPINTTPPQAPQISFDTRLSDVTGDLSMLWPQNLATPTAHPQGIDDLDPAQHLFHSANIFHNQESLSL